MFGWIKQAAGLGQLKALGRSKVGAVFRLQVVAYNLIRITNLLRTWKELACSWKPPPKADCGPSQAAQEEEKQSCRSFSQLWGYPGQTS